MTAKPNPVEVELAQPHTHAGKPYKADDKIKVAPAIADWLRDQGIAKPAAPATKKGAE